MPTVHRPLAAPPLGSQPTGERADQISTTMGFAAITLWSANIGIARSLAESVGAVTSTALMFLVGGGLGMLVAVVQGHARSILGLPSRYLVVCGAIFVGYTVCLSLAIGLSVNRQQTLEVAILNYLWPSLTLLFSIPILGKRVKPAFAVGFVVALGGVVLAPLRLSVWDPELPSKNLLAHPWPYVLATIAAVLWGLYSNLSRRWAGLAPTGAVPLFSLAAGGALVAIRPLFTEPSAWSTRAVLELLFMALFPTLIAYGMWDRAMRRGRVTLVVSASYAIPVMSTLISAAYLQVPVAWNVWTACGLVAVGASLCHASMDNKAMG